MIRFSGMTCCKSLFYTAYCYQLVKAISLPLPKRDPIKQVPLYNQFYHNQVLRLYLFRLQTWKRKKNETYEILITNSTLRKSWITNLKQFLFLSVPSNFHSNNWGLILHNTEWKYKNVSCSVPRNRNAQTFQEWASQHKRISHCHMLWKKNWDEYDSNN